MDGAWRFALAAGLLGVGTTLAPLYRHRLRPRWRQWGARPHAVIGARQGAEIISAALQDTTTAATTIGATPTPAGRRPRDFLRLWASGLIHPTRAFVELGERPAPEWGFWAVTVRFVVTSLTTTLSLLILRRTPFTPPYLTFIAPKRYYAAELFFLPMFGLAAWLLMSATAYLILHLRRHPATLDQLLNIVGFGMLVPMPPLWVADWAMIATGTFRLPAVAVIHATVELWEALLFAAGFRTVTGLGTPQAVILGVALGALYVGMAMIVVR